MPEPPLCQLPDPKEQRPTIALAAQHPQGVVVLRRGDRFALVEFHRVSIAAVRYRKVAHASGMLASDVLKTEQADSRPVVWFRKQGEGF